MKEKRLTKAGKRNRKLLANAFLELLQEKSFQKITITEIAERAEMSRGVFYNYFTDIFDLIRAMEDELIEQHSCWWRKILSESMPIQDALYLHDEEAKQLERQYQAYKPVLDLNLDEINFYDRLTAYQGQGVLKEKTLVAYFDDPLMAQMTSIFVTAGFTAQIKRLIELDFPYSISEIGALTYEGLRRYLDFRQAAAEEEKKAKELPVKE